MSYVTASGNTSSGIMSGNDRPQSHGLRVNNGHKTWVQEANKAHVSKTKTINHSTNYDYDTI